MVQGALAKAEAAVNRWYLHFLRCILVFAYMCLHLGCTRVGAVTCTSARHGLKRLKCTSASQRTHNSTGLPWLAQMLGCGGRLLQVGCVHGWAPVHITYT